MKREENNPAAFRLFIFSILYGLFFINYIDLVVPGSNVPGYHAWLGIAYFISFIPIILMEGLREWRLVLSLGLMASLMNDLFYYPVSMILFGRAPDLYNWYLFQLGFKGFTTAWTFNAGFFTIKVTSILMGTSIYLRAAIIAVLTLKGRIAIQNYSVLSRLRLDKPWKGFLRVKGEKPWD
ncbi:hypothetical protein H5T51_02080 [Candidatus Bathyarchaeota archaeon]|nr:hypothetical protein [Candidatus Bathyarchaeota archaeon]